MNSETIVILYDVTEKHGYPIEADEETETWRGTFADFLAANELSAFETEEMAHNLMAHGGHHFGGGAQQLTVLRIAR